MEESRETKIYQDLYENLRAALGAGNLQTLTVAAEL